MLTMLKLALVSWAIAGCAGLLTIVAVRALLSGGSQPSGLVATMRSATREIDYLPGLKTITGRVAGWTYGLALFFGTFYRPCDPLTGAPCGQWGPELSTIVEFTLLLVGGLLAGKKVFDVFPAFRR